MNYISWSKEKGFYYDPDGYYARRQDVEKLIQQLRALVEEAQHNLLACGHEKDELRARAEAAEHRRAAAEYRAQRIVLDEELKAENGAIRRRLREP